MIYQTILDLNEVLLPVEKPQEQITKKIEGKLCYGIEDEKGEFKVSNIFSTDPQDYLDEKYSV